jgi:chemotaxis protein methyltransferase CheR
MNNNKIMTLLKEEDIRKVLDQLQEEFGYDFTNYSQASLCRRINRVCQLDALRSSDELQEYLRADRIYLKRFVEEITVNVTEMFRDPGFYFFLQQQVFPELAKKPFFRIWHAGCSTGEEVLSLAILLKEAGLLERSLRYATDLSPSVLEKARKGMVPLSQMKKYSENYRLAGGDGDFSSYYTAHYGQVIFQSDLLKKLVFSVHNLVSDRSFNEFDLIVCRNVLIYFNKDLQERVIRLFDESLVPGGFLALGSKETLRFSSLQFRYAALGEEKVWQRKVQ